MLEKPTFVSGPAPTAVALRSTCASTASHEMMAPSWVALSMCYFYYMDTVG